MLRKILIWSAFFVLVLIMTDSRSFAETHPEAIFIKAGAALMKEGKDDEALAEFTKAIEVNPFSAAAYYDRANIYAKKGNVAAALADYYKAVELDPNFDRAVYIVTGPLQVGTRNYEKGISDLTKAIEINPSLGRLYHVRALAYFQLKEYQKAQADLKTAQSKGHPSDPKFEETIAKALSSAT